MTITAAWVALLVAGLLEVCWAIGLKYSHGFSRLTPSIITLAGMVGSVSLLSWSLKCLPVGVAYVVWVGIGAAGTAIIGMVVLGEPATAARIVCIAIIVAGVAGLKLTSP